MSDFPVLTSESKSISLQKLTAENAVSLAVLANNKKIWDNLRDYMPYPYTLSDAKKFIELAIKANPYSTFGIIYEGELCGIAGLNLQTDIYRHSAEIGYWIGEAYWGRGIATIAVELITNYAFNELKLVRIYTSVYEYNPASMRVLEKNEYQKEGIGNKAVLKNGRLWNEHWFGKINKNN